jgi:hypothetical protein
MVTLGRFRSSLSSKKTVYLVPKFPQVASRMMSTGAKINKKQTLNYEIKNKEVLNEHLLDKRRNEIPDLKDALQKNPDPFSVVTGGINAMLKAILATFTLAILYGAYDSGYRRTLRTSFPWGAQLIDLVIKEEGPSTVVQEESDKSATDFRKTFAK